MGTSTSRLDRGFALLGGGLVALAWLALWAWSQSRFGWMLDHRGAAHVDLSQAPLLLALFAGGWVLMTIAMMLPGSLPLVHLFRRLVRRRADGRRLVLLLVAGYLAVWAAFGVAVHLADWQLHGLIGHSAALPAAARALAASTLALAGLYQFTPLKYGCLERCRSPFSFVVQHWQGRRPGTEALRLGLHHGLFCLGCCWALMLVMFVVGAGNLAWMLLLGAVMALEKNAPAGPYLSAPLGAFLLGWAIFLALGILPAWP